MSNTPKLARYEVKRMRCECHPETCCCNPYGVIDKETLEILSTHYTREAADSLCKLLNRNN